MLQEKNKCGSDMGSGKIIFALSFVANNVYAKTIGQTQQ